MDADTSISGPDGASDNSWGRPPGRPVIHPADVHVWSALLRPGADTVRALRDTLTPDERARADRFHADQHRDEFTVARGMLRAILARYLTLAPGAIRFDYGAHGKPSLARHLEASAALRFNLSHADGLALYAVARDREIGVDVEFIRDDAPISEIVERFFSPDEIVAIGDVPQRRRPEAFFNCWTRKEAYVKALGAGLSHLLDGFTVSIGTEAALLHADEVAIPASWTLASLVPRPGCVGAVAVRGPIRRLHTWHILSSAD